GLLEPQLKRSYDASTRAAQTQALRRLVADARDGHGVVTDAHQAVPARVPLQLAVIDSRPVVVASRAPGVPVGAVIAAGDGISASDRFVATLPLISGSVQWRQYVAAQEIGSCAGSMARLTIEYGGATQTVEAPCGTGPAAVETRPPSIAELRPGIWYVDLT